MESRKKYFLFIDESGDHGLVKLDPSFPVFLLCGIICSQENYENIRKRFNEIKEKFWQEKKVIFHSRDIRKCENEFQILFNLDLKKDFYKMLNASMNDCSYRVISSAIEKEKYIKNFGKLSNDVYELALSFIIERAVFSLDEINGDKELDIIIEKRGAKEDRKLYEHFQRLLARGTGYVSAERLKAIDIKILFKSKKENINGLQLADLIAYPIARFVIDKERANPAFEVIQNKIYKKGNKIYGLKIYP